MRLLQFPRRKLALAIALFAFAGTLTAIVNPPSASAAAGCSYYHVCVWTNKNYSGSGMTVPNLAPGKCYNFNSSWNDKISSFWSNYERAGFYTDGNCSGRVYPFDFYDNDSDLSNNTWPFTPTGFNDKISSVYFYD